MSRARPSPGALPRLGVRRRWAPAAPAARHPSLPSGFVIVRPSALQQIRRADHVALASGSKGRIRAASQRPWRATRSSSLLVGAELVPEDPGVVLLDVIHHVFLPDVDRVA